MIKMTQLLLAGAVALALSDVVLAQDTLPRPTGAASAYLTALFDDVATPDALPSPLPSGPNVGVGGGVVEALPKTPNLPASLFAPSPPPSTGFLRLDGPYFARDPLLDPAQVQPPGWFAGAEIQIIKPHLIPGMTPNSVHNQAQQANGTSTNLALPSASLDWTVSPRVFAGYRLPSGFGEFMVAYRHLGTQGVGFFPGANGPTGLNSRFAFDLIDFDYRSSELSLGPKWDMNWAFGLRTLVLFFDSQAYNSFGQGAAGNGFFQASTSNNFFGMGPHAALNLSRHLGDSGWSLCARGDFAGTFDDGHEAWLTRSTTLGPDGRPLVGATHAFGHTAAPMITAQVGVTWQPAPTSGTRLFLGYQYEVIWDLDRVNNVLSTPFNNPSLGQFWNQGVVMQATFRY